MSLSYYFGCEKVKAGGNNNNLEATKKDDQNNSSGVSKSTAELAKGQESFRKRFRTFQELWKTGRPWLKFDKKTPCSAVIADSFQKVKLNLEAKKVTTVSVLMR